MSATTSLTQRIREREPRASSCGHRARSAAAGVRVSFDIYISLQSVSQLFHGPAPRSPLHRLAVRLRHSRSNISLQISTTDIYISHTSTQNVRSQKICCPHKY